MTAKRTAPFGVVPLVAVTLLASLLVAVVGPGRPGVAGASNECFVGRVVTQTEGGANSSPSVSADGSRVAFVSNRNIEGQNPDENDEIFVAQTAGGAPSALTSTQGGANSSPSMSADGSRVAFVSNRNIEGQNPDGNDEIFVVATAGGAPSALTSTQGGANSSPSMSADGSRVAFVSNRNIEGQNPDGNDEIFVAQTAGGAPSALTSTQGGANSSPSISGDGSRVAFVSNGNIVGQNPDGNDEIFVVATAGGAPSALTSTQGGASSSPSISGDGSRVAFVSNGNIVGQNPDGNDEIFVVATAGGAPSALTSTTGGANGEPSMSADGTRVAFVSDRTIEGNPDLNDEIYVVRTNGGLPSALTSTTDGANASPSISTDGSRMAFVSDRTIEGNNLDLNDEIYVAGCTSSDVTPPTVDLRSPLDGATFARDAAVDADYSCADEAFGSGLVTCIGNVADGAPIDTSTLGEHDVHVDAVDHAGNFRRVTHTYTVEDVTDPTVDLVTPADGDLFARHQVVDAVYSCDDDLGLVSCVGTVDASSPIDTSSLGDHDFTVTATDQGGNTTEVTHTYTVAAARPDGRIKKGAAGTYLGNNVYNTTGAGQTKSGAAARGSSVTYYVSAQNDAPFADALRLKGTAGTTRFGVTYSVQGVDVTSAVVAGTYTTPVLAPGAAVVVKVVVKVKSAAPTGSSLSATVTAKSTSDTTHKDVVKFVTSRV